MQALHRIVSIGLFTFALLGCAGIGTAEVVVYQDDTLRVALEADPTVTSERSGQNDHPVGLEVAPLTMLLAGVEVERQPSFLKSLVSGPTREPAFSRTEASALATRLTEALARASAKERVSFSVMGVSSSQVREITSGKVWVRGGFHFALNRHRSPAEGQRPVLPSPLEPSFSRGRPDTQAVRPDFSVLFSLSGYSIKQEPSPAAQLFASPETEVVIDHQRFFADAKKAPEKILPTPPAADRRGTIGGGAPDVAQQGLSVNPERLAESQRSVQALSDRVKILETQVTDLLEIVKRLTGSLEEARKALAAKESELRAKEEQIQSLLKRAPKTPKKPK